MSRDNTAMLHSPLGYSIACSQFSAQMLLDVLRLSVVLHRAAKPRPQTQPHPYLAWCR